MTNPPQQPRPAAVTALCALLWVIGAGFGAYGLWLVLNLSPASQWIWAALAVVAGAAAIAAGVGLFQMRRWGAVLFGVLALLGSINYLAGAIFRFSDLSSAGPAAAASGIISLLAALAIPLGLIYFTLLVWRQTR
jgi:hypothetical protein